MNTPMPDNHCPECGAPLTPGAALGLCPRCLLAGAAHPSEPTISRSSPPSIEQVAAAFPQLEIVELIGHGGMGAVFKVRQPKLDRFAALKLLPQSLAANQAFASRFEREARLLARLNHANIVAVYDHGQAGEFFYLLMEYVDGVNLRQAMRASRFTPPQALGIIPKICEALQYAHDEGVLHRDIKPENILLDAKGRVKLADFGIAKLAIEPDVTLAETGSRDPALTQAGAALGTPQYMAPEQRETPDVVDHRADIYSLGVVFYELLTGELPAGNFVPPSEISAADPRIDAIVQQALQKEREHRQQSATEVKTQVETAAQAARDDAPRGGFAIPHSPSSRRAGNSGSGVVRNIVVEPAIAMVLVSALGIIGKLVGAFAGGFAFREALAFLPHSSTPHFPFSNVSMGLLALTELLILVNIGVSVFTFAAGLRMYRTRAYGIAMAGGILLGIGAAMGLSTALNTGGITAVWALAELGIALWVIMVLSKAEVKAAFQAKALSPNGFETGITSSTPGDAATRAASPVAVPAIGLMIAASLSLLLLAWAGLVGIPHAMRISAEHNAWPGMIPLVWLLLACPSIITFLGGWRMRQLRGYGLSVTAAILAIITPPGLLLGMTFGIWALIILSQRSVRECFKSGKQRAETGSRGAFRLAIIVVLVLCSLFLLLGGLLLGGYLFLQRKPIASAPVPAVSTPSREQTALEKFDDAIAKQRLLVAKAAQKARQLRQQFGIIDSDPENISAPIGVGDGTIETRRNNAEYMNAKMEYTQARRILEAAEIQLTKERMTSRDSSADGSAIQQVHPHDKVGD